MSCRFIILSIYFAIHRGNIYNDYFGKNPEDDPIYRYLTRDRETRHTRGSLTEIIRQSEEICLES